MIKLKKLLQLLLLSALPILMSSHTLSAQELQSLISVDFNKQPLRSALKEISTKADIKFVYNAALQNINSELTYKADKKSVQEILEDILPPFGIGFNKVEKQIVLFQDTESEKKTVKKEFTVSGIIRDSQSGEFITGANVYTAGLLHGTISNPYGFYSLSLPAGEHRLYYSFLGFEAADRSIDLSNDTSINIYLKEGGVFISEVEIKAAEEPMVNADQMGKLRFDPRILNNLPAFAGDVDIIKSLNTIPGISNYGDGSTMFYVRGGNSDQNLILIDDAPIYNPTHLFGFFTALAPDAIRDIEIYKGDFPAQFGGRLSSVIDIRTKEGNLKNFGFSGNLGPYTSALSLEGPLVKDKSSFFLSGRRSNLQWLNKLLDTGQDIAFDFYDIHAKLNFRTNQSNRFYFSFYKGNDDYVRGGNGVFGIGWNNVLGSFRWNHILNPKVFFNTTLYFSRYEYFLYINKLSNDFWKSAIHDVSAKTDMTWYPSSQNTVRMGLSFNRYMSNPGNLFLSGVPEQESAPVVPDYHAAGVALYASHKMEVSKSFTARYGLRFSLWQNQGPATVYYFDNLHQAYHAEEIPEGEVYNSYFNLEPRFSLAYKISRSASLKANYTRAVQYLQILSNSTSPFTSLEVWIPAGPNILPQKSDQTGIGYFQNIIKDQLIFSAELFYKKYVNQVDFEHHANVMLNPFLEGEIRSGSGRAYGLELLLQKSAGKLQGWIAYTHSRSFRKIEDINKGETYPAFYDRPHDFNISLTWKPNNNWSFSANWFYISGGAITTPVAFYYNNGYQVPLYDEKNNDRLPDYHRLDLSAELHLSNPERRYQHSFSLTLYNAYANENPFAVNFNKKINKEGKLIVPQDMYETDELVPSTISVSGLIPSLNYNFNFR